MQELAIMDNTKRIVELLKYVVKPAIWILIKLVIQIAIKWIIEHWW
jgi:hypothetical protein